MTDSPIFQTFKPENPVIARYVNYYYLDYIPDNRVREFECFPHYNHCISLYKSHTMTGWVTINHHPDAPPLQVFSPLRDHVLRVKQSGAVHRIVIVFHPLGIKQFYRDRDFSEYFSDYSFFSQDELEPLFSTWETGPLSSILDAYLLQRYQEFRAPLVSSVLESIMDRPEEFSMVSLSSILGISRRHISRVFKACLGVPPKKFHEIVLFRKILDQKLYKKPAEKFSALAYDAGLSDQAHMIKVFRKLTGHSPKSFVSKGTYLGQEDTFWHLLQ